MTLPHLLRQDPLGFWERVAHARRPLLGLDYDGTLAPFRVDRMAAVPADGARRALRELLEQTTTRVVVVSGRLVADILELLGDLGVLMVGSHGYERRDPDGALQRIPLTSAQTDRLARAQRLVTDLGLQRRLERKAASLAFHTRGLARDEANRLERQVDALWSRTAADERLRCTRFNGGVELRAEGIDKGTVLGGLLDELEPDLAVYIGDDLTDEDAFRVLRQRGGVGIKVGPGDTSATARLPSCSAVVQLLDKWLRTAKRHGEG